MNSAFPHPLPRLTTPTKVLQVFLHGKPSAWLGQGKQHFWFHYNTNTPEQEWVSLLMPPAQNYFSQGQLFGTFSQYLPNRVQQQRIQAQYPHIKLDVLDYLSIVGTHTLGAVSFVNPDHLVVRPRLNVHADTLENLAFEQLLCKHAPNYWAGGLHMSLIVKHKGLALECLAYPAHIATNRGALHLAKTKHDPHNKLIALRWLGNTFGYRQLWCLQRPDFSVYTQKKVGFESLHAILNIPFNEFQRRLHTDKNFPYAIHEIIRTYCEHSHREIQLFDALLPDLRKGCLSCGLMYQQDKTANPTRPVILGLDYLPKIKETI